ncbi:hypothetical protein E6C60_4210 [Paenibacillus algicola]|uniref:Uncharacterized protein n=1 Tax=Paenibacillus algicola TaxID=2565926 RepID=A0A4P8XRB6_9BACL|nr:hypothetical protein E6C60_4210 [Paenibacillus algicola]
MESCVCLWVTEDHGLKEVFVTGAKKSGGRTEVRPPLLDE